MDGPGGTLAVLTAAIAASPEPVGIGLDGTLVFANRSFVELFGYDDASAIVGRPIVALAPPSAREVLARNIALRASGQSPQTYQSQGQRLDGSLFDAQLNVITVRLEGRDYALAVVHDISAQRASENQRRDREEFYRAMFEVNTAIKLLIDPVDSSIIDANPAAADFYGWSLDELRRMKISEINTLSPEQIEMEMERARTRKRMAFRFRHRTADGSVKDVDVYSGPVVVKGRQLLLSIIHDVTERNQLEEELRRAHRLDAIGRLAAGIAHDFNNLLTVVLASAQIAERQLAPEHRVRAFLGDIRHAAQRGAELTRQLLAFARQQALAPASIDLVAALARIAGLLERVLGDEIQVVTDVPDILPRVRFDPGQLELAVINVALNARDAMPKGGTLTVRAIAEDGFIDVVVEDTGFGMDAETRARAFEPFFTTKPAGQGTGLGLATVYGIISQSGGQVAIESAPGAGTLVHLRLPVDPPAAGPTVIEHVAPSRCAARSVLLVDDRADVLDALTHALADVGIHVHKAGSARAAIAQLEQLAGDIDVVLSDVAMPEQSGLELAVDVRARWPHVPVVLMSGNARPSDARPEVAAFLDKPFTLSDVLSVLDRVVRASPGA
ncbi:MAG TPA: PAS domain S-box protein [Kofleriaceae bacterium]|nr:PAS domain S-box protein [Kofleriaceae bacterium]